MDIKGFVKGFDAWERSAAEYAEQVFRSPLLLNPIGAGLTALFRTKADADRAVAMFWSAVGLPTREGEERTLHALNELQSRMMDLEERLASLCTAQQAALSAAAGNERSAMAEPAPVAPPAPEAATPPARAPVRKRTHAKAKAATVAAPRGKARQPARKSEPSKLVTAEVGPPDLFAAEPSPVPPGGKRPRSRRKTAPPGPPNG